MIGLLCIKRVRQFCGLLLLAGVSLWVMSGMFSIVGFIEEACIDSINERTRQAKLEGQAKKDNAMKEALVSRAAGTKLFASGKFTLAEAEFAKTLASLRLAQADEGRIACALNNLAASKHANNEYTEADAIYSRAEKSFLFPQDHRLELRILLKNHAALKRRMIQPEQAALLEKTAEEDRGGVSINVEQR